MSSLENVNNKKENLSKFPRYGWKVSLDHTFPEKRDQRLYPRLRQLPQLLPLFFRYLFYYFYIRSKGRKPFIDCISMVQGKQIYGVPLGGIGCGTIGRGFKGEFCRYQMIPGIYEYNIVTANQFLVTVRDTRGNTLYQKVLSPLSKCNKSPKSWEFSFSGTDGLYCGLYPRSWTVYNLKETGIRLICRQISPVIPNNYKDTSLPVGVFVWTIENNNEEPREVSITLTFKNGTGSANDKFGECWTEGFTETYQDIDVKSVSMHQTLRGMNLCYCLAVKEKLNVTGSFSSGFDPCGSGEKVWNDLKKYGELTAEKTSLPKTRRGEERAIAVCGKICLEPHKSGTVEISLSWDMPQIVFKGQAQTYTRRYSKWFKNKDSAAKEIASYALSKYLYWEDLIEQWQDPILKDPNLPDWFKSALFNELYFISDGGSIWVDLPEHKREKLPLYDSRREYGHFAYLESHEYRMYNTYDVHFYASWALIMLWPELQKSLQYDMAEATSAVDLDTRIHLFCGDRGPRTVANAVPHDLGDPEEEPFIKTNSYRIHDTSEWKDLNLKFVLQVFRDYTFLKDENFLSHMWPICRAVMDKSFTHVKDSDGLIANNGHADQTYDSWVMHGPSAYCCSLWVAALAVMVEMAALLKDQKEEDKFSQALQIAKDSMYEKLWNGKYFKFDSCNGSHSKSIMADQLVGHWYLTLSGLRTEIFTKESVKSILALLFEKNVMSFKNGEMGAVNGMNPDGSVDTYTMQSEEMWVGVAYGLASTMIVEGMTKEGFKTAEGVYKTVYEKIGQGFETPEALYSEKKYRAVGYMRPLSIWSMLLAYQIHQKASSHQE